MILPNTSPTERAPQFEASRKGSTASFNSDSSRETDNLDNNNNNNNKISTGRGGAGNFSKNVGLLTEDDLPIPTIKTPICKFFYSPLHFC